MRAKTFPLLAFGTILLLSLACTLPQAAATQSPEQALETAVAATLTAFPSATTEVQIDPPSTEIPSPPEELPATEAPTDEPTAQPEPPAILQVAYIKNGNVYVWTENGGSIGLSNTGNAINLRISDDGQVIAFINESPDDYFHQELWAVNTSGPANQRLLMGKSDFDALKATSPDPSANGLVVGQFDFRPGTHFLAYSTTPRYEGPGFMLYEDIRLINCDNGSQSMLFDFGQGGMFFYSPDGNQLALVKPTSIGLANADGSNLRSNLVTFPIVSTHSEYLYYPKPHWAPDSSSLRVTIPPASPLDQPLPPTTLWHIPIDGSPGVQLGSIVAMPFDWPDNAYSPDLSRLVYVKPTGEPAQNLRELHLANADGSNDSVFYQGESVRFMQWVPNSSQFVFQQWGAGDMYGVHIGNVNGETSIFTNSPEKLLDLQWVTANQFLYLWQEGEIIELRLNNLGAAAYSTLIDNLQGFPVFDFDN